MTVEEILSKAQSDICDLLQIPVVVTYTSEVTMSAGKIMSACAEYFKVSVHDMKGRSRQGLLPVARQCFCYICREKMRYKLVYVGFGLEWKHDNVIKASNKIKMLLSVKDELVSDAITAIVQKLFHHDAP